jgi:hypothetical protein
MNAYWSIETHGDPLGAVREFVKTVWLEAGLDGMLVAQGLTLSAQNRAGR